MYKPNSDPILREYCPWSWDVYTRAVHCHGPTAMYHKFRGIFPVYCHVLGPHIDGISTINRHG